MIKILDSIIEHALMYGLNIKYVALSQDLMKLLVTEVMNTTGHSFTVETLVMYRDVPLKVKDIIGFQVAYELNQ